MTERRSHFALGGGWAAKDGVVTRERIPGGESRFVS
jgi:hypothetical protein